MTTFLKLEHFKSGDVAILTNPVGGRFRIAKRSLERRIENLKKLGIDVSEEQRALKALDEVNK